MRTTNKFILFCLLFTSFLSVNYLCVSDDVSTLAYYSDVESCTGNTITAGVWNTSADNNSTTTSQSDVLKSQSDVLNILSSYFVTIPAGANSQYYWQLSIRGSQNLSIDKIQVGWNDSQINNSYLTKITINENVFFSGSKSSGELVDGTNYSFISENAINLKSYFNSDVSDLTPLTINITMGDGSVKNYVDTEL